MSVILAVSHIKVGLYCTNHAFLLELTFKYFFNVKKKKNQRQKNFWDPNMKYVFMNTNNHFPELTQR